MLERFDPRPAHGELEGQPALPSQKIGSSPVNKFGHNAAWADTLLDRFLQPAAKAGWRSRTESDSVPSVTYSTLLKANGEDVEVVRN